MSNTPTFVKRAWMKEITVHQMGAMFSSAIAFVAAMYELSIGGDEIRAMFLFLVHIVLELLAFGLLIRGILRHRQ